MKKIIFVTAFIIMAGIAYGQTLQKGNVVRVHVYTINLDPDVTMNQYLEVWANKLAPALEENSEVKYFIIKGIQGECENCFGDMWIFESKAVQDKYFKEDGTLTKTGQEVQEKIQPELDELARLGTSTQTYTDWIVQ